MRSCALNMSTNWSPTRITGLSTFIALWKTSETWRQRKRRSSSRLIATRSSPRKRIRPPETWAGGLRICRIGVRERALAAAGLAGEAERLAGRDRERDAVDRAHAAVGQHVVDRRGPRARSSVSRRPTALTRDVPVRGAGRAARCAAGFCWRSRGLLTSSRPARMKTSAATVSASATPGEEERPPLALQHGRVDLRPVERHAPARAAPRSPRPRNSRPAAVRIAT